MAIRDKKFFDRNGESIILASELGRGGEGAVYEITNKPNAVAKIYYSPVGKEKSSKLAKMAGSRTERLLKLSAWPIDTLHSEPDGPVVGFVMEQIREHKEIHFLYSPKSRLVEFPDARWPFLIHASTNLARAFAIIHEHGHVIGDVNHGNVVVSREATVKLIDCDSFQISVDDHLFPCEVGVSTHTPPELQGVALKDVVRTTNHDNFGLAVLIFQLLFMGRHPFSGEFSGPGEMSLERAICERRFAYGNDTHGRLMKQPPGTLSLNAMSARVAELFEQAFLQEQPRPYPEEWITALGELSENLRHCFYNRSHSYHKNMSACPWCDIEVKSRTLLFNAPWNSALSVGGSFNLPAVWKKIETAALPEPRTLPSQPALTSLLTTSDESVRHWRGKLYKLVGASSVMIFLSVIMALTNTSIEIALAAVIVSGTLSIMFLHKATADMTVELVSLKEEADMRWHEIKERWFCDTERTKFKETRKWLLNKRTQYQSLERFRQERIAKLEADLRKQQFDRYLARIPINDADIADILPANKAVLETNGIHSALELRRDTLVPLADISPRTAEGLLSWRQSVERLFVFDPQAESVGMAIQKLDHEIATIKINLERDMHEGQSILDRIVKEVTSTPRAMATEVEEVLLRLAQIEADSRVGVESHTPMGLLVIAIIISLIIVVVSK